MLAGGASLALASPASADSAAYFNMHSMQSDVPTLLPQSDREYYRSLFTAIEGADWQTVQKLLDQRQNGPLHKVALAQYYLAATSPRVELSQIENWLSSGRELPYAERMGRLGLKRGLQAMPSLPSQNSFYRQAAIPKRLRPGAIEDGTVPPTLRSGILERITKDDPDGAKLLLEPAEAMLSGDARTELRQRIAWSYYIENRDSDALAMALSLSDAGSGAWLAEADWVAGLAAWRLGDCMTSYAGFQRAAARTNSSELSSAAHYWASRAAVRCRMPDRVSDHLREAARSDDTLYGMLAAEQLGAALPDRFAQPDFSERDWNLLGKKENVRAAIELVEIGRDDLASELLIYQARIGSPDEFAALSRLARCLGLPATQLFMANNAPSGAKADPAANFPTPKWMPVTGWKVDPALAYAHALQESNFRTSAVSPAQAKGLMQITPITVREHSPRLNMNASSVDLNDPRVNLAFGQQNLEMLRDSSGTEGKLPKIMAAYNAGLNPITRWNSEVRDQNDPLLYMESIPYWETRGYVAIVMRNYWMYERQAQSESPSRKALAQGQWPAFPGQPASGRVWLSSHRDD